jgi:hypothetical protein
VTPSVPFRVHRILRRRSQRCQLVELVAPRGDQQRPDRVKNRLVGLMMPAALNCTVRALSPSASLIGKGHGQRNPELARVSTAAARTGCNERHLAILDAPCRPPRRLGREDVVDLASRCGVRTAACRSSNLRNAGFPERNTK